MITRPSVPTAPRRLTRLARSARHALRRFRDDRSGAIAQLFAVALLPIIGIAGGAVDYTMASGRKVRLQSALDAATLAATRSVTANSTNAQIAQIVRNHLNANLDFGAQVELTVVVDAAARKVDASATLAHQPYLLPVIGISSIPVGAQSSSQLGRALIEVALVLDNSGSMAGSRITTLRSSATDLMKGPRHGLYPGRREGGRRALRLHGQCRIEQCRRQLDRQPGHLAHPQREFLDRREPPDALFADAQRLLGRLRRGAALAARCHRHRAHQRQPGDALRPQLRTRRARRGTSWAFYNNYLGDGSCQTGLGTDMLSRQRRTCKYSGATPDTSLANGTRRGPNQLCDSNPIIPLTASQTTLTTALTAMPAYGGTNLHEAVMWGWRVLSPEPPFTEGRAYNTAENRKIMVLMTDGANDAIGLPNMNGSFYSAYGYSAAGRLGTTSSNRSDIVAKMNEKTLTACTNAKALGIQIYTVGFYVTDATAQSILQQCATNPSMALLADSDQGLANAFDAIGDHIKRLRLTN